MTPWPSWTPPAPRSTDEPVAHPRARRWRAALVAGLVPLLALAAHGAIVAASSRAAPPTVRLIVAPPPEHEARVEAAVPITPTAPVDAGGAAPLLRTYRGVAVHQAHPAVILAWSLREVAFTADDGATWTRSRLPGSDGAELPVGTVTADGAGLLSLGLSGWLRVRAGVVESVAPPIGGVVTAWATGDRWTYALVSQPDEVVRTIVSADRGTTWRVGPDAPQGAYAATLLPDERLAVSYAWSASCGGGAEGVMALQPGGAGWVPVEQPHVGHLTPDLHVLAEGCEGSPRDVLCAWPPGAGARPAVGPSLARPAGSPVWFASGRTGSFAGTEGAVYRVEGGSFRPVDTAAPWSLDGVVVDGRGGLVGLANGHVVRWSPAAADAAGEAGAWRVHLP